MPNEFLRACKTFDVSVPQHLSITISLSLLATRILGVDRVICHVNILAGRANYKLNPCRFPVGFKSRSAYCLRSGIYIL